jgi:hypothetical protein
VGTVPTPQWEESPSSGGRVPIPVGLGSNPRFVQATHPAVQGPKIGGSRHGPPACKVPRVGKFPSPNVVSGPNLRVGPGLISQKVPPHHRWVQALPNGVSRPGTKADQVPAPQVDPSTAPRWVQTPPGGSKPRSRWVQATSLGRTYLDPRWVHTSPAWVSAPPPTVVPSPTSSVCPGPTPLEGTGPSTRFVSSPQPVGQRRHPR